MNYARDKLWENWLLGDVEVFHRCHCCGGRVIPRSDGMWFCENCEGMVV